MSPDHPTPHHPTPHHTTSHLPGSATPARPGVTGPGTTVLGYPRIGPRRELKRALEAYWAGRSGSEDLLATAAALRADTWRTLAAAGLDSVPSNTFSLYDHLLDAAVMVDAVPPRFRDLGLDPLDTMFAMARGADGVPALELTKWFDTNYHCLVPEIAPDTTFRAVPDKAVGELAESAALGVATRPVLVGPVTLLLQAKPAAGSPAGFTPLDRLADLLPVYAEILTALAAAGAEWVQLDEPAFVTDRSPAELDAIRHAYEVLGTAPVRPRLLLAGYFGDWGPALPIALSVPVDAVTLDLVSAPGQVEALARAGGVHDRAIVAGLVDGRNVWRTDLRAAAARAAVLRGVAGVVDMATSCSLLHVPLDLDDEPELDPALRSRMAFARQKVDEVVALGRALREGAALPEPPGPAPAAWCDDDVRSRLAALGPDAATRPPYAERARAQRERIPLPPLPTTTIGSFPQTASLRQARADLRSGRLDAAGYAARMQEEITAVVALQERLGLDVLVHGEPERNDMVQYFAERLTGFATTRHGWVQSYGSRCVRPPVLYADVARPAAMTVAEARFAQSLTRRPVKGMLTGPVTVLAWSFVREDQPLADTARQVALALREECADLEAAGIAVIQVDEPALRELMPHRREARARYLEWAVSAFRLATGGVAPGTQVHTHLCYSEFGEVLAAVDALDADVTSIEASRSRMEILDDLRAAGYARGVGPGVWDIHSPRVPDVAEVTSALEAALGAVPPERLWVNPDCGLKTRDYPEVEASLRNLVEAARSVRATVARLPVGAVG